MKYLQNWLPNFYPERLDIVKQFEQLAAALGGKLEVPVLSWKYAWIKPVFGWGVAKRVQVFLPQIRWSVVRAWDKALFRLDHRDIPTDGGLEYFRK